MSKRLFKEQIHRTLEILRSLFSDANISQQIDDIYEDELMLKVKLVPEKAAEQVCHGIDIFKAIYSSVNVTELVRSMKKLPFELNMEIDVYKLTLSIVGDKKKIPDSTTRAAVVSIIKQCKPILDCFTLALADPLKYLQLISATDLSQYDSLL